MAVAPAKLVGTKRKHETAFPECALTGENLNKQLTDILSGVFETNLYPINVYVRDGCNRKK